MIYVLSLLACLTAQPDRCERYEMQVQACGISEQAVIAVWLVQHPKHELRSWSCEMGAVA